MRRLEFIEVEDGWTLIPEHANPQSHPAAFMQWFCPSLTRDEAEYAARIGVERSVMISREPMRAFLRGLFERE